jgi:putative FmdB family regulatory protein
MALYEYVCMACERRFEERRSMSAVDTEVSCPSCGADRVRRRFAFVAARPGGEQGPSAGGCACGGACGCG